MKSRQLSFHMIVFCKTKFELSLFYFYCLVGRKELLFVKTYLIIFILQANPKTRGYLWFCTECDESVSDWELWITRGGIFHTIPVGGEGEGTPKGMVFAPFWSEKGYRLCLFWSEFGYGFRGNTWTYLSFLSWSFQFQMNKKELKGKSNMRIRGGF